MVTGSEDTEKRSMFYLRSAYICWRGAILHYAAILSLFILTYYSHFFRLIWYYGFTNKGGSAGYLFLLSIVGVLLGFTCLFHISFSENKKLYVQCMFGTFLWFILFIAIGCMPVVLE